MATCRAARSIPLSRKKKKDEVIKATYLEADRRRKIIYEMWSAGMDVGQITKKINKVYTNRRGKPYSDATIRKDLTDIKKGMVETAQDMLGNQKVVVANFLQKSLITRQRAIEQGDLGLVYRIDKDIMKLVGVNIDAVNINVAYSDTDSDEPEQMTFFEIIRAIREKRGLPEIGSSEI